MEARNRTRTISRPFGAVTFPGAGGPQVGGPRIVVTRGLSCDDFWKKQRRNYDLTGSGLPPSDLDLDITARSWTPLNGGSTPTSHWFHNYPADNVSSSVSHLTLTQDKGNPAYVLSLLKKSNPLRPEYSVPVAIRELVDVTQLFSFAAKSFASVVGGAYLNYRFGWLSFLQDIRTLAKIVERVQSRVREINSLKQLGGLKRRVPLDSFGAASRGVDIIHSTFAHTFEANRTTSTRRNVWGSVRWYPVNPDLIPEDPGDAWLFAVRQIFDLEEIDSSTLWNLVPWTWLIDYFSNLGDILAASEGRELVEPRDICIMRETITIRRGIRKPRGTAGDKVSGGGFVFTRTTKSRDANLSPSIPAQAFSSLLTVGEFKVVLALIAKFRG